jgi:HK97 family phage major capsid protein
MMSKTKVLELRQKRAKLIADARGLLDTAETAKRDLTSEEQTNWDTMMNDADALRVQAERAERLVTAEADLGIAQRGDLGGGDAQPTGAPVEFQSLGLRGLSGTNAGWRESREWRNLMRTTDSNYVQGFRSFLRGQPVGQEVRALQADLDTAGGYLMTPMQMVDALIKAVDDAVYMRRVATVYSVPNADSLGVPTLENDPADADWTTELATGSEDSDMSFGRRELKPHPLAKRIKISRKLLMKVPNAEELVLGRLAYKFGITAEKAYLTGSGAGQPLGIFTAHADGVPTSRDVSTGNTTTGVTFDGLLEAKFTLKTQYWARAQWMAHRDFFKMVAKLKSGDGDYIWRESVRVGEPDRLLGLPTAMSEYAPNTFTTGQYVGALFDPSQYWIADSMAMEMQRLTELYAETNQIGLIGRMDTDGQPVSPGGEAFVRVKLA